MHLNGKIKGWETRAGRNKVISYKDKIRRTCFRRAPISQWCECRGFVLWRHHKERFTWLHISPIVVGAPLVFYLAALLRLGRSRTDGQMDVCSSARCVLGVADAEPRLRYTSANGRSSFSQVCQPLSCFLNCWHWCYHRPSKPPL